MRLHIAVAGGGIGGLSAALALARAGHRVTVIERRTGFSETGAGLQLSPNASRVLLGWGFGAPLRRAAGEPERVTVRAIRSGRTIGGIALKPLMRDAYGAPYWAVARSDLHTILLDAARADPAIRFLVGRGVEGVSQGSSGVEVTTLSAGRSIERLAADALVGADGVWSKVRPALGDQRPPRYRGFVAWRATIDRALAPPDLGRNETSLWLGPRAHVVHYPIDGGLRLNIVAFERRKEPLEGWSAPGARDEILGRFESATPVLRDLLGRPQTWLCWSLFDLPVRRMAMGRVALLGDAAHPVLPFLAQGAALAIEDAAALAEALTQTETVEAAFAAYQRRRMARCRRVQSQARLNGFVYHAFGPVALGRDTVMRFLGPEGLSRRYAWLYGHGAGAAAGLSQKRFQRDTSP